MLINFIFALISLNFLIMNYVIVWTLLLQIIAFYGLKAILMTKLFGCIGDKLSKNSYISSNLIDYDHFEDVTDGLGLIDFLELGFVCCDLEYLDC